MKLIAACDCAKFSGLKTLIYSDLGWARWEEGYLESNVICCGNILL